MVKIELNLWCEPRVWRQIEDARNLANFANGLPKFDSIYSSWLGRPKAGADVLRVPLTEATAKEVLLKNIARYDDGRAWPEIGSRIDAGHAGIPPFDFRKSSYADTSCSIGSLATLATKTPNYVFMRLSDIRPSTGRPWRASELRPLMKFARDIWAPMEMCAMFSFWKFPEIADPTWAAGVRLLFPSIGWITYLPPDLAARAQIPADVHWETLDDGAALVTLCEEPFDNTDAEGVARLHALETALRPLQS